MADDKDTDPTPDEAVDGSDAAARSRRRAPRSGQGAESGADGSQQDSPLTPEGPTSAQSPAELSEQENDQSAEQNGDDRELVGVGARTSSADRTAAARSTGGKTATGSGPQKKGRATPKQRTGTDRAKRTSPAEFVRGSVAELKKVVYPSRSQLGNYFVVVLVFVLIIIAIVTGLDYGFGWVMLKVFT